MVTFESKRALPVPKNPETLAAETQFTDVSNSKLFTEMFRDQVCFSKEYGGWYVYNGKIWQKEKNNQIKNYAIEVYERLRKHLKEYDINNRFGLEAYAKHVKASGSDGKLTSMVNRAEAFLGVPPEDFDKNQNLFNCNNGTMDLKTMEFRKFNSSDMLTKMSLVDYISGAEFPLWYKFLDEVFLGNKDVIDFIQRAVGYSMTASIDEHCMFILYGQGLNGKTTFVETLSKIFGMYSIGLPPESIMNKKPGNNIPNDIARLKGARRVTVSESKENVTLDEALIKRLTGGDLITARFLNKEFFDFYPIFKMFLYTNKKPNIHGTDIGIWRRIRMIPFDLKITEENKDKDLPKKLEGELPGILNWALEGCRKWQEAGLNTPQKVLDATNTYQLEEDDIGQFIEDHCVIDKNGFIPVDHFKDKFKAVNSYWRGWKTVSDYMHRKGYKPTDNRRTMANGSQVRVYVGIRLKDRNTTADMEPERQLQGVWDD